MASAETRGDDRTKPLWGAPAPAGASPSGGSGSSGAPLTKAEAARLARQQAKAARAEARAARARAKQRRTGPGSSEAPAVAMTAAAAAVAPPDGPPGAGEAGAGAPSLGPPRSRALPFAAPAAPRPAPAADRSASATGATGAVTAPERADAAAEAPSATPAAMAKAGAKAPTKGGTGSADATTKGKGKGATKATGAAKAKGTAKAKGKGGAPPAGRARDPQAASRAARARALRKRYAVVHDVEGPRVRLGVLWFLVALVGIFAGAIGTAIVFGVAAAIAAAQTARIWRKQRARPHEGMAAAGAGAVALGASLGAGGAGLGLFAAVGLAFVGAAGDASSRNPRLADVGWTLQAALPPALVAMSMVLLTRLDQGSAIALLLLVSAFDTGDFVIGSGARNPYEGPAAGVAAIVVITFIVSTLPISTLSFGQAWLLGGAVAVLAPAGQLAASALLPSATAPASALRRLDSLLIAAPLWAWAVGLFD